MNETPSERLPFTRASSGETQNSIQFNHSGVVRVESGTLAIWNNDRASTITGAYYVASGAILRLQGPQHDNLSGVINATGEGTIEIFGTVNVDGTFTFPGSITISSGYGGNGTLNLSTETTTADIGILNLSGFGTVTGPGDLTAGTINWDSGTMSGSGSTNATSTANFTGSSNITLNGRTFNNAGAATWNRTGSGYLYLQNASSNCNNQAGATFTVQSSGSTVVSGYGTFKNAGTLDLTTGKIGANTFKQEAGGITNLAIRGTAPIADYCQVIASVVDLTGPLNITFAGGFAPQPGDDFILLSYSTTRTGDFSPVNIAPVRGLFWSVYYRDDTLHLGAIARLYIPSVMR